MIRETNSRTKDRRQSGKDRRAGAVRIVKILLVCSLLYAIYWGIRAWFRLDQDLYTNDAQVEEYINPVNVRIPGYIKEVRFTDHQRIRKGDTLVLIDDREYLIQAEQAEAAWLAATAARKVTSSSVSTASSSLDVDEANIRAVAARVWNAAMNERRLENLLNDDAATRQQTDQARSEYSSLLAQMNALERQRQTNRLYTAETAQKVGVNDADIKRTHAALALARLNLSYTVITAPYDGVAGRRMIQEGQFVGPGQLLLNFVRSDSKWVVANYMETQIQRLHIGEKMILTIDGLEDREFTGRIEAISEATGSSYSAIPVDNSTGNFIKVRQRIPVRIGFVTTGADSNELERLKAGMNAQARVAATP
jgi:membrane fusion protein, multidrug efflux system